MDGMEQNIVPQSDSDANSLTPPKAKKTKTFDFRK